MIKAVEGIQRPFERILLYFYRFLIRVLIVAPGGFVRIALCFYKIMRKTINIELSPREVKELHDILTATYRAIHALALDRSQTPKEKRIIAAIKSLCKQSKLTNGELETIELATEADDGAIDEKLN